MAKKKPKAKPEERILKAKIATDEMIKNLGVDKETFYAGFMPALLEDSQTIIEWLEIIGKKHGGFLFDINENMKLIVNRWDIMSERLLQIKEGIENISISSVPTSEELFGTPRPGLPIPLNPVPSSPNMDLSRPETWTGVPQGLPPIPQQPIQAPIQAPSLPVPQQAPIPIPPQAPGFPQVASQPQAPIQYAQPVAPPAPAFVPASQAPAIAHQINSSGTYNLYGKITGGTEMALKIEFNGGKWSFCPKSAVINMANINPADTINFQLFNIRGWKVAEMVAKGFLAEKDAQEVA